MKGLCGNQVERNEVNRDPIGIFAAPTHLQKFILAELSDDVFPSTVKIIEFTYAITRKDVAVPKFATS